MPRSLASQKKKTARFTVRCLVVSDVFSWSSDLPRCFAQGGMSVYSRCVGCEKAPGQLLLSARSTRAGQVCFKRVRTSLQMPLSGFDLSLGLASTKPLPGGLRLLPCCYWLYAPVTPFPRCGCRPDLFCESPITRSRNTPREPPSNEQTYVDQSPTWITRRHAREIDSPFPPSRFCC